MKRRAKIFQNGGSQAVRLPRDCRFPGQTEVLVRKEGRKVVLEPADEWSAELLACLGAWNEPIDRLPQPPLRSLRSPLG